jgi:hypothetical protein
MARKWHCIPALCLVGCLAEGTAEGDGCPPSIQHEVRLEGVTRLAAGTEKRASSASVVLDVYESSSIGCKDGLMSQVSPGQSLMRHVVSGPGAFSLELERTVLVGFPSDLELSALLDENDNGECDPGEMSGYASVGEGSTDIVLTLDRHGCPFRI